MQRNDITAAMVQDAIYALIKDKQTQRIDLLLKKYAYLFYSQPFGCDTNGNYLLHAVIDMDLLDIIPICLDIHHSELEKTNRSNKTAIEHAIDNNKWNAIIKIAAYCQYPAGSLKRKADSYKYSQALIKILELPKLEPIHIDVIRALLATNPSIHIISNGHNIVSRAAASGHWDILPALINYQSRNVCESNYKDSFEHTLYFAVKANKTEIVKSLVENKGNIYGGPHYYTSFDSQEKDWQEANKCSSKYNDTQKTLLHLAVTYNNPEMISILNFALPADDPNENNFSAIDQAAHEDKWDCVKAIIQCAPQAVHSNKQHYFKALLIATEKNKVEIVEMLLNANVRYDSKDQDDTKSPAIIAFKNGLWDCVDVFIKRKNKSIHELSILTLMLNLACENENPDLKLITDLIENGANPNGHTLQETTPLHAAIKNKNDKLIAIFLQCKSIDLYHVNSDGYNFVAYAASLGYWDIMPDLSKHIQHSPSNETLKKKKQLGHALYFAVKSNREDMVKLFLCQEKDSPKHATDDNKAVSPYLSGNILPVDKNGDTVLHIAAATGNENIIILLSGYTHVKNKQNLTPIEIAINNEHWDCIIAIVKANISNSEHKKILRIAVEKNKPEVVEKLLQAGVDYSHEHDQTLDSPGALAIKNNYKACIEKFIQAPKPINSLQQATLDLMMVFACMRNMEDVAIDFLNKGANPNIHLNYISTNILQEAIKQNHRKLISQLIQHKDIDQMILRRSVKRNDSYYNLFVYTAELAYTVVLGNKLNLSHSDTELGYWDLFNILIGLIKPGDFHAYQLGLALCFAIKSEKTEIAKFLLEHGANPGEYLVDDPKKNNALHLAIMWKNPQIISIILQKNPDLSEVMNGEKKTPAQLASETGDWFCMMTLLAHIKSPNSIHGIKYLVTHGAKNNWPILCQQALLAKAETSFALENKQPLHWAAVNHNPTMTSLLLKHGARDAAVPVPAAPAAALVNPAQAAPTTTALKLTLDNKDWSNLDSLLLPELQIKDDKPTTYIQTIQHVQIIIGHLAQNATPADRSQIETAHAFIDFPAEIQFMLLSYTFPEIPKQLINPKQGKLIHDNVEKSVQKQKELKEQKEQKEQEELAKKKAQTEKEAEDRRRRELQAQQQRSDVERARAREEYDRKSRYIDNARNFCDDHDKQLKNWARYYTSTKESIELAQSIRAALDIHDFQLRYDGIKQAINIFLSKKRDNKSNTTQTLFKFNLIGQEELLKFNLTNNAAAASARLVMGT